MTQLSTQHTRGGRKRRDRALNEFSSPNHLVYVAIGQIFPTLLTSKAGGNGHRTDTGTLQVAPGMLAKKWDAGCASVLGRAMSLWRYIPDNINYLQLPYN